MAAVEKETSLDAARLSDAEKDLKSVTDDRLAGFADPDAGLSEEERAEIVRINSSHLSIPCLALPCFCMYPTIDAGTVN